MRLGDSLHSMHSYIICLIPILTSFLFLIIYLFFSIAHFWDSNFSNLKGEHNNASIAMIVDNVDILLEKDVNELMLWDIAQIERR